MMRMRAALVTLLTAGLAACASDPVGVAPSADDLALAADIASLTDSMGTHRGMPPGALFGRMVAALRASTDPAAQALLAQATALADSGRAAQRAGDREAARAWFDASHEALFDGIVLVLPDAYANTHALVDSVLARAAARLGGRDAPRAEAVLAVADSLHQAAAAVAAADEGHALALDMQALMVLHRMRDHLRHPMGRGTPGDMGGGPPFGGGGPPPFGG